MLATAVAALGSVVIPLGGVATATHVGTVTITPPISVSDLGVCSPYLVTTSGGSDPVGAVVDVEALGDVPVEFCQPEAGVNPVLIDPTTGDLGPGPVEMDGTIGGEAVAEAGSVLGEGAFTFGISTDMAGSFDITVFVEEPGAGNDDPGANEPQATATQITILGGGNDDNGDGDEGTEVPGATQLVTNLDCVPKDDIDPSGSVHNFVCRATGAAGLPILGAEVSFDVTGGPNAEEVNANGCGFTDTNGAVTCDYRDADGPGSPAGTDEIVGFTGSNLQSSLNQDTIHVTFAGSSDSAAATKVASKVSLRGHFRGRVRSTVSECKSARRVLIKKVRKGRDLVVAKKRTNERGAYKAPKRAAKGRFYAIAKKKSFTSGGSAVVCKKARSRNLRVR